MSVLSTFISCCTSQWLLWSSILGVIFGTVVGILMKNNNVGFYWYMWIGLPGELFMRALQMGVIPVIITNLILVTSKINPRHQGRIVSVKFGYVISTAIIGSYIGILVSALAKLGINTDNNSTGRLMQLSSLAKSNGISIHEMLSDLFRNLVPNNLVEACLKTIVSRMEVNKQVGVNDSIEEKRLKLVSTFSYRPNLLGLMASSIIFGIICKTKLQERALPLLNLCQAICDMFIEFLKYVIWTLPVSAFSLTVSIFSSNSGLQLSVMELFQLMGQFILTFFGVLVIIHVIQIIIFVVLLRINPLPFLSALLKPYVTAFTMASCLLAFPAWLKALSSYGTDERILKMVFPLALGLGSVGSMAFVVSSCLFISQLTLNITLPISHMLLLGLLCPINTMALPAIPSASIVAIVILLESLNIPTTFVPLLFATEFILDRLRTGMNIINISICSLVVERYCPLPNCLPNHINNENEVSILHLEPELKEELLENKPNVT